MRNAGCEVAFDDTTNETCIWMTWVCHAMLVVQQWWWWHRGWRPRWRWRVRQRSGRLYKQDIRSLSNATFSFGTSATWLSSSSKSAAVDKISSKSDDFSLRYGDISIFKMAAVRHLGIVLPPYETTPEVSVAGRSFFLEFWGLWTPKRDYSSSRPPKGTSLRKSAFVKLSTEKIRWGVWRVGELTKSDGHTDRQRHRMTAKAALA